MTRTHQKAIWPGDRVRMVGTVYNETVPVGTLGTVQDHDRPSRQYDVKFDDIGGVWPVYNNEIERLEE